MKRKFNFIKRTIAAALSAATFLTSLVFVPTAVSAAGDNITARVIDNVTKQASQFATMISGEQMDVNISNVPADDYNLDPETPFEFVPPLDDDHLTTSQDGTTISGSRTSNSKGSIKIDLASSNMGDDTPYQATYQIRPRFNVYLTDTESCILNAITDDSSNPGSTTTQNASFSTKVNSDKVSITDSSTIKLTLKSDYIPSMGDSPAILDFKPAVVTGDLIRYNNAVASMESIEGNKITVKLVTGNDTPLILEFNIPTWNSLVSSNLKAGTEFSVTFSVKKCIPMQITVYNPKRAVNEIATNIGATNKINDYLTFAAGDRAKSITKPFTALRLLNEYNSVGGFSIEWKWQPDNPVYPNVLQGSSQSETRWLFKPYPELTDIAGKLVASVKYTAHSAVSTAEIPVIVIGRGIEPSIKNGIGRSGKYDGNTYKITETSLPDFPDKIYINRVDMDVNNGSKKDFPMKENMYYEIEAELFYGLGINKAEYVTITPDNPQNADVSLYVDGSPTPYVSGTRLQNDSYADTSTQFSRSLRIKAEHEGTATVSIDYYKGADSVPYISFRYILSIDDSSPGKDASMRAINIAADSLDNDKGDDGIAGTEDDGVQYEDIFDKIYPDGKLPLKLEDGVSDYELNVPYAIASVDLSALYNDPLLDGKPYTVRINGGNKTDLLSGDGSTVRYDFTPAGTRQTASFSIVGTAQDGETVASYTIRINRMPPTQDASLDSLEVRTRSDDKTHTLTPAFSPSVYDYTLTLPYAHSGAIRSQEKAADGSYIVLPGEEDVRITATLPSDRIWSAKPLFESHNLFAAGIFAIFQNKNQAKLDMRYEYYDAVDESDGKNAVKIYVYAEDKTITTPAVYTVNINIADPDENSHLGALKASTQKNGEYNDLPFVGGKLFNRNDDAYAIDIDYSLENIRFEFMPESEKAQSVRVVSPDGEETVIYKKKGEPITRRFNIPNTDDKYKTDFTFEFYVTAEKGNETETPYVVTVSRAPASTNADLASIALTNRADSTAISEFTFIPTVTDYSITVPYTVEGVIVTPLAKFPELTTVTANGRKIDTGRPSLEVSLASGKATKIEIVVVPESGDIDKKTYTINITRSAPNTDARLLSLVVNGGSELSPRFVPSTINYSTEIPEGTVSYTITAMPVEATSTVTVNGKSIGNGGTSEAIVSTGAREKVTIVVTAEDGKTKKTYTVNVTDYNYLQKGTSSNITNLDLLYADISPNFKPGLKEYEVYLKDSATSVEFTPTLARGATSVAKTGSKAISMYDGTYAVSVFDEQINFTITVTSQDGLSTTDYIFYIYKKDEEKQGSFKPITAEMVNYNEADPIVIDIRNYAIVDASVFNTLKTDYPNKSILFTGNDYSLKIKGSDITKLVPNTSQYDLFFSFTSPDEEIVTDIIAQSDSANDIDIDPVYIYFNDHGDLPGKMLLTLSLGGEYKNSQIFWNYYNDDRERIDYYGYLNSNAKGTISVPITHFSTYLVTKRKISVSEDKTNMNFGSMDGIINGSGNKDVPRTGVSE